MDKNRNPSPSMSLAIKKDNKFMKRAQKSKCKSKDSIKTKTSSIIKSIGSKKSAILRKSSPIVTNVRSSSLSSIASRQHLSIGRFTGSETTNVDQSKEMVNRITKCNEYINKYGEYLHDSVLIYLFCPIHKKVALSEIVNKGLFLPYGPIKSGESWKEAAIRLIQQMIPIAKHRANNNKIFQNPILVDLLRIQVPIYYEYIIRVLYSIELTSSACHQMNICSEENSMIAWYNMNEIKAKIINNKYLGPEPILLQTKNGFNCREISICDSLYYVYENEQKFPEIRLLLGVGYREDDLMKLYSDFIQHCYPSEFMTQHSLKSFFAKWQFTLPDLDKLILKFFIKGNSYLNFNEFLLGLASIDKSILDNNLILSSPLNQIRSRSCYPSIHFKRISATRLPNNAIQSKLQRAREFCENCRSKNYTLSLHMVKMSNDGNIYEPVVNNQSDVEQMVKARRILSERYFTKTFVCNQMIDMIHAYAIKANIISKGNQSSFTINRNSGQMFSSDNNWLTKSEHFIEKILKICKVMKNMFSNCNRVIRVTSPCYVIGDIHGNLHDLLIYERTLWKNGPYFSGTNYLFLGDYVDRGDYSVECIVYLFCMKILAPDHVFMLRGNHECRSLQKEFTFYDECKQKFGSRAEDIWETFNEVFDLMPLCAIVDESIFCAHGGIPSCAQKLEQIMLVKSPLKEPEQESDIACEILWNDPVTKQEFHDLIKNMNYLHSNSNSQASMTTIINDDDVFHMFNASIDGKNNHCGLGSSSPSSLAAATLVRPTSKQQQQLMTNGFLPNTKRGTACYYSDDALNTFLNGNNLSHVIRAHEVIPSGYQYHMHGKCITIFSCSHYCGGINEAAVCYIQDSKIRVIKIDTNG